jgi:hypothetical protein
MDGQPVGEGSSGDRNFFKENPDILRKRKSEAQSLRLLKELFCVSEPESFVMRKHSLSLRYLYHKTGSVFPMSSYISLFFLDENENVEEMIGRGLGAEKALRSGAGTAARPKGEAERRR